MLPLRLECGRKDHHDVFAVLREVALVAGAKTFAEADQQQQRTDSPGDANMVRKERSLCAQRVAKICRKRQTSFAYLQLVGNDSRLRISVVPRIASRAIRLPPLVTVTRTFKLKCYGPLWSW